MNTFRYTEEERRMWVHQKTTKAKSVKQICQEAAISRATLYIWIKEFVEETSIQNPPSNASISDNIETVPQVSPAKNIKINSEATRYKMLASALAKVDLDGSVSRKLVAELVKRFTLTITQACEIVGIEESVYGYKPRKPEVDDELVHDELLRLISEVPTRGFAECYDMLITAHPDWTRKQIKRIYRERRLYINRKRVRKNKSVEEPIQHQKSARIYRPEASWTLGMLEPNMHENDNSWVLYILDNDTQIPLNATIGAGMATHQDIIHFLNVAANENGKPKKLRVFGKEPFNSREITRWVWDNKVALHTLSLNKPENMAEATETQERVAGQIFRGQELSSEQMQQEIENWIAMFA